jgi:hypothetical protein
VAASAAADPPLSTSASAMTAERRRVVEVGVFID